MRNEHITISPCKSSSLTPLSLTPRPRIRVACSRGCPVSSVERKKTSRRVMPVPNIVEMRPTTSCEVQRRPPTPPVPPSGGSRKCRTASDRVRWVLYCRQRQRACRRPRGEKDAYSPPHLLRAVFSCLQKLAVADKPMVESMTVTHNMHYPLSMQPAPYSTVRASCSQSLGRLTLPVHTYRAAVASEHALATVADVSVAKRCGPAP